MQQLFVSVLLFRSPSTHEDITIKIDHLISLSKGSDGGKNTFILSDANLFKL
jgi:hypothetical protein